MPLSFTDSFTSITKATTVLSGIVLVDRNVTSGQPIAYTQYGLLQLPPATANKALVSLGEQPFDGTSSNHFVGRNNSGTFIGINTDLNTYGGSILDFQSNGVSFLRLDNNPELDMVGDGCGIALFNSNFKAGARIFPASMEVQGNWSDTNYNPVGFSVDSINLSNSNVISTGYWLAINDNDFALSVNARVNTSGVWVSDVAPAWASAIVLNGRTTSGITLKVSASNVNFPRVWIDALTINNTGAVSLSSSLVAPGAIQGLSLSAAGLVGATAASRYVGGTVSGAPTTGTFLVGDFVIDQGGKAWICTLAGSPGTWTSLGGGSVTSVALSAPGEFVVSGSPVTSAGTLTLTKATQAQNAVWAGPSSGSGVPTFRALVAGDIPALSYITSVALALPNIFSVSGSPVTSSGTLTGTLATQSANQVFAGPGTGVPAAPTFRSLVAADIPALDASKITTGLLAPARGGTGVDASTVTDGQLLIGQTSGNSFGLATLTAGAGISVTNAGHSITIAATSTVAPFTWVTKTANYTVTTSDTGILVDATTAPVTITLPTAVGAVQAYAIKKKDASTNAVTVATTGGQTIDGGASYVIVPQDEAITVGSDNSNWWIV